MTAQDAALLAKHMIMDYSTMRKMLEDRGVKIK